MTSSHSTATFTFYHTVHTLSQSTNWKMLHLCGNTHINIFKHTTSHTHTYKYTKCEWSAVHTTQNGPEKPCNLLDILDCTNISTVFRTHNGELNWSCNVPQGVHQEFILCIYIHIHTYVSGFGKIKLNVFIWWSGLKRTIWSFL